MAVRFVVIGGGPAGIHAAITGARLGAEVTVVERDVFGGAANLWDCIPSKAMIATGAVMSVADRAPGMGLQALDSRLDLPALAGRIKDIETGLSGSVSQLLESQGVRLIRGRATMKGPHEIVVDVAGGAGQGSNGQVEELTAEAVLVSTGSRPRIPDFAEPLLGGGRVLTTRDAYPPPEMPEHLVVIGSGVTGVEFVHMFRSLGSAVSLIVSRQHVLPQKDAEVAAALEEDFLRRGVNLLKGGRAAGIDVTDQGVTVRCEDGRTVAGSHALLAVGSIPNSEGLGLDSAGVEVDAGGYVPVNQHCQTNVGHVYAAGDLSGRLPLASVAAMQGRKVAEHVMGCTPVSTATSITTRRPRPSSPSRRSPTWGWPKRKPSLSAARSASPRCRLRPTPGH
jgi:dihydrolipoamide dehydrogenase